MTDVYVISGLWAVAIALAVHVWPRFKRYHELADPALAASPLTYMKEVFVSTAHDVASLSLLLTLLGGLAYLIIQGT